jgi:hypothetical protein
VVTLRQKLAASPPRTDDNGDLSHPGTGLTLSHLGLTPLTSRPEKGGRVRGGPKTENLDLSAKGKTR